MLEAQEILVDIPDHELPKLAAMYERHAQWAPYVLSFIQMAIRWKKSEDKRNTIIFTSPNNCWNIDGTIIVTLQFHCHNVFIFSLNENCEYLYRGLMETKRIDFQRRTVFFCVHEKHMKVLSKFIEDKNLNTVCELQCILTAMPPEEAKLLTVDCPADVYVDKLDPSHAVPINAAWPHRGEDSEKYIATLIEMNGGYGVFLKTTNELVAWVVKHCFDHLGMLQVTSSCKKKGYGSLATKALAKEIGEAGYWPFATVMTKNTAARSLLKKIGFQKIASGSYIAVIERKNN